ncbi:F420-dependent glucose-6-phosphate dehydrogenase [Streptomyces sp. enrichment culture]
MEIKIGYKLAAEAFGPTELIRQAVAAEEAGFDFVEISDHFHPWLDKQGHSPFAWSVLGGIAARTSRVQLATGVTCPTVRYHPAIIAQAAATLALMSDGRFVLGLGSGERLNEHVVGKGFPDAVRTRHEMLREALEIIRLLWRGGYRSYEGKHLRLEDARVFDLPDEPPLIAVAAGGPASARLAAELGDGLFATDPEPGIVGRYREAGGAGPRYAEVPMAWAPDEHTAARAALETNRWAVTGWKVMSELPNPVNFDAATTTVREEDILGQFACGTDPDRYVQVTQQFVDAGFDHLVMQNAGPDPDGFLDFYRRELDTRLRGLRPRGASS